MKIERYPFVAQQRTFTGEPRLEGVITFPQGSKIIYFGVDMLESGALYAYCEVSPIEVPEATMEVIILQCEDVIPNGYKYVGHILAKPLLFVYERGGISLLS